MINFTQVFYSDLSKVLLIHNIYRTGTGKCFSTSKT